MLQKLSLAFTALFFSATIISCNNEENTEATSETTTSTADTSAVTGMQQAVATLSGTNADTTVSGTALFTEENGKVRLQLQVSIPAMANKSVAVHIHENGSCGDGGKAAGAHWNPSHASHGKWGEETFHSGDIGNVDLDSDGNGRLEMETDLWAISDDAAKNIINKAVIVHSGSDDFKTQPTGNAGGRIGCGVIQKGQ